ncbi:25587_t:CDS:2, partial [Gigaspora rosea]
LHLAVAMLRSVLQRSKHKTIEKQQKFLAKAHIPSSPSTLVKKAIVPETCRSQAEDIMAGLLSGQEEKVGWRWKDDPMKQTPLRGEWVESKTRKKLTDVDRVILYIHGGAYIIGSAAQERFLIQKVAKEDSGFEPINPKNIVIMGDSAGGGLALSLLLVLRDVGLPQPVGATCWSPWVDLFHSLPSIFTNASTDYLPSGLIYKASPANPIKDNTDIKQRLSRIQYYAHNSALDIPYVSPILADDLGGLGEIFI